VTVDVEASEYIISKHSATGCHDTILSNFTLLFINHIMRLLLQYGISVLKLFCHQLELISFGSALVKFLAQNEQGLRFALKFTTQGRVLQKGATYILVTNINLTMYKILGDKRLATYLSQTIINVLFNTGFSRHISHQHST
jgi:hypothetical protein